MSKLDLLIENFCPQGVSFKPLGEVVRFLNGRAYKQAELLDEGKYKVLRVGNFYTNDKWYYSDLELDEDKYCENGDLLYTWAATLGPQIWSGETVIFHYHIWKLVFDETVLNKRFLYYFLAKDIDDISKSLTKSTMPHVSMASMNKRLVPIPPMEVQSEIVRIMDNFTKLTAELTAELTARQKQYNYYRNKLLTFDNTGIPIVQLRTVVKKSCSGSTPTKGNIDYYNNGTIPWIRTQDVRFNEITEVDSFITEKAVAETAVKWIPENCVIVAISGATAGRCAINKIKATTNQHCLNLEIDETKALYRYIYYCIYNKYDELISRKQGARGDLNSSLVLSLEIPVPPLDVQKRLVYVLDNFDAICSDLKIGLPAEIEARQKQYKFYRDALLTYAATGKIILTDRQTDRRA